MRRANERSNNTAVSPGFRVMRANRQDRRAIDPVRAGVWGALAVAVPLCWIAIAKGVATIF